MYYASRDDAANKKQADVQFTSLLYDRLILIIHFVIAYS